VVQYLQFPTRLHGIHMEKHTLEFASVLKYKVKVKVNLEQATKTQMGNIGITLLFL